MNLPAIASAAYVSAVWQSVVRVTYVDSSTALVYPNNFTDPRTQQLNQWVFKGGQITPYEPPPQPVPGPPSYISCTMGGSMNIGINTDVDTWQDINSFGLNLTSNKSVTLTSGRTYQIVVTLSPYNFSSLSDWVTFNVVNANTNAPILANTELVGTPTGRDNNEFESGTTTLIYSPTEDTSIKIRATNANGTCQLRNVGSWTIAELVDETLYAEKVGPRGPAGPEGPAGPTGATGPQGPKGNTGAQGPQGIQGVTGPQGAPGPGFNFMGTVATQADLPTPAAQGDAYTVTATNTLWIYDGAGIWNDAGVIQGPQGVQGSQGPTGPAGPEGPTGPAGPTGATGPAGAQGPIGPAGPTGLTGAPGPAGPTGPIGPQGPAGPAGAAGPTGPSGLAGAVGPAGPAGPAGATGPAGPAGPAGPQGPQGPAGSGYNNVTSGGFTATYPLVLNNPSVQTISIPLGTTEFFFSGYAWPFLSGDTTNWLNAGGELQFQANGSPVGSAIELYCQAYWQDPGGVSFQLRVGAPVVFGANALSPTVQYTLVLSWYGESDSASGQAQGIGGNWVLLYN